MASRKITDLTKLMQKNANALVRRLDDFGIDFLIYCTYRSPEEQARLYRQSRTTSEIYTKINRLKSRGFPFLAQILIDVGPQGGELGKHVTWAGPGESWHQYGEALDGVAVVKGKCAWSVKKWKREWDLYGHVAAELGLNWGGNWKNEDYPHCQMRFGRNPTKVWGPDEIQEKIIYQL